MEQRRTLLMADDHHVLYRSGTRRALNPPVRHAANPVLAPSEPWEVAIGWTSIYRDPTSGRYQLWYQAFAGDRAPDRRYSCVVCYAESDDGIHFTKPALYLFPFGDIQRTNIVLIGSGGHSFRYCNSVLVDERAKDSGQRYKMAYFDWAQTESGEYPGLCVAFSPDGIHWQKHERAPLSKISYGPWAEEVPFTDETSRPWAIPLSMSDGTDVFFDPLREVYAWYGKMWLDGPDGRMRWKHAMGRIESKNFIDWSAPEVVCTPDDDDAPHVEFHTTPVFYHAGLYCCLNQLLDRAAGGGVIDVELMLSRDGLDWQRPFRQQFFLPRGAEGCFDSGSIFTNSTPVVLDHEMRFYYGGYSQGATSADNHQHASGVGLAVLPRDRFAGIAPLAKTDLPTQQQPLEQIGQVTLKPLELENCKGLTINADAQNGRVRVEVLDVQGRRLHGFSREEAVALEGDLLAHEVRWQERTLDDLGAGEYLLRLHLENATVYALSFLA
jgi:hypothetical protein